MRIVFGIREFKIKSFTPEELGISSISDPEIRIEAWQKYFHLYWIPVFGTDKKWVLRKGSNTLSPSPQVLAEIQSSDVRVRTPWRAFALPILLVLGVIVYVLQDTWHRKKERDRSERQYEQKIAGLRYQLAHLNTDAIIDIRPPNDYHRTFLKVEEIGETELKCTRFEIKDGYFNDEEWPWEAAVFYNKHKDTLKQVTVKTADLRSAFTDKYADSFGLFKGKDLLHNGTNYCLKAIDFQFAPNLKWGHYSRSQGSKFLFELYNSGDSCVITNIQTITGNIGWDTTIMPIKAPAGSPVNIEGYTYADDLPYQFKVITRDGKNRVFSFEMGRDADQIRVAKRVLE